MVLLGLLATILIIEVLIRMISNVSNGKHSTDIDQSTRSSRDSFNCMDHGS